MGSRGTEGSEKEKKNRIFKIRAVEQLETPELENNCDGNP